MGGALTTSSKELIALLVAMLVLVGLDVAYAANTYPAYYAAIEGGDRRYSLLEKGKEREQMRRVTLMLAAVAVNVGLFAAVVYAATIEGTSQPRRGCRS
jgi:hypothetical protein